MALAAASISKLRAPMHARTGWEMLAPAALRHLPFWLPIVAEAVLAVALLLPGWVGRLALIVACLLLAAFAVALARAVARGNVGECGCFGSWSDEPISRLSVVRTTSLAAVAALAAATGWSHPGLVHAALHADRGELVTGLVGAALGLLSLVLSVMLGRTRVPGSALGAAQGAAGPGDRIPAAEVVDADGAVIDVRDLPARCGVVVVAASLTCGACAEVLAELPRWQESLGHGARIVVVTSSARAEFLAAYPELAGVTYWGAAATRQVLGMVAIPSAVLLGVDGTVATPVALGAREIRGLLAGTANAVQAHSSPST